MIANEREYWITQEEAARFAQALEAMDAQDTELDPRLQQAMRESLASQLEELRGELAAYNAAHTPGFDQELASTRRPLVRNSD